MLKLLAIFLTALYCIALLKISHYLYIKFIQNKEYFFKENQKLSLSILVKKLSHQIFNGHLIILYGTLGISISILMNTFFHSGFEVVFESTLIICLFCACRMDIKTMEIDGYLSTAIMCICFSLALIKLEFHEIIIWVGLFSFAGLVIYLIQKFYNKCIIGQADLELFIGMMPHFDLFGNIIFITLSGLIGIVTKILINTFNAKQKKIKEFPFIPAIAIAFYLLRINKNTILYLQHLL